MDFHFGGLGIVENDPIVVGSRLELTKLVFVAEAWYVWL